MQHLSARQPVRLPARLPACFRVPSLLACLPACCPEAWLQVLYKANSLHSPAAIPSCLPACPPAPRLPVCSLLVEQWPLALALLGGLLSLKITVISLLGPYFGLTRAESVRTGFVLSQVRHRSGLAAQWAGSAEGRQRSGQAAQWAGTAAGSLLGGASLP